MPKNLLGMILNHIPAGMGYVIVHFVNKFRIPKGTRK